MNPITSKDINLQMEKDIETTEANLGRVLTPNERCAYECGYKAGSNLILGHTLETFQHIIAKGEPIK